MAQEALKKLDEELKCSICLDTYTDPKQLQQCSHVYCQKCLVQLVDRNQQVNCPGCRQVTLIPARGVAGLQSAFHINRLLEIQESVKNASHCALHELELYCETCRELICKCCLKGGKHHDHDYEELYEAFKKYKEEMQLSLEPLEKQVMIIREALAQFDTHCREISDQRAATANNIHSTFRRLHEALSVRETELIGQLDQITQGKLKALAAQRDQIETTLAQLNGCLHFVSETLRSGSEGDVLLMITKANTVRQVEKLTTPLRLDFLKPNTKADVEFAASADMTVECQKYGQVFASGADPSRCHVTGEGAKAAVVGGKATAILQAIDYKGEPCEEPIKSLECKLVSELTGTKASCGVERRGQSQYEISYQPTIKGRHQLHITVGGQHVRESPITIAVKSPIEKLGTPIRTVDGLKSPWGVAVTQRGDMVVTEFCGHCVSVFSSNGEKIRSFGTRGSGEGQFKKPCGVAVDSEGNILVADNNNHRIQKFTLDGQFLTAVGTRGSKPLQFENPADIAFNTVNHNIMVYVTDEMNNRIQVLNSDLTFSSTFGTKGIGEGQFKRPVGISCDHTGNVYVADSDNDRIQVFTAEGEFLRTFGRFGHGSGELHHPVGIFVDPSGMVYVCEGKNNRVSVFTSDDQFVTSFGWEGKGPGGFDYTCGIAVDASGVVYVCDSDLKRLQLF